MNIEGNLILAWKWTKLASIGIVGGVLLLALLGIELETRRSGATKESSVSKNLPVDDVNLEDFDKLFVGDLAEAEKNLRALLPRAEALDDKSIYMQILSQIALAQAVQKQFDAAHQTLDRAEKRLTPESHLAKVRILTERGRVFWQSGNIEAARPLLEQSFKLSAQHHFDYHTANAAHLIAIITMNADDKIKWNTIAIDLAQHSESMRAREWLGSLYHNLGQAYLEAKQYENALTTLTKAEEFREQEGYAPNIRVAKWAVARALRLLDRSDEALRILLPLINEYDAMAQQSKFDMPIEVLPSVRGLVYEELAEIYASNAKTSGLSEDVNDATARNFARMAYEDLSKDEWFKKLEFGRLDRLSQLKQGKQSSEDI